MLTPNAETCGVGWRATKCPHFVWRGGVDRERRDEASRQFCLRRAALFNARRRKLAESHFD